MSVRNGLGMWCGGGSVVVCGDFGFICLVRNLNLFVVRGSFILLVRSSGSSVCLYHLMLFCLAWY